MCRCQDLNIIIGRITILCPTISAILRRKRSTATETRRRCFLCQPLSYEPGKLCLFHPLTIFFHISPCSECTANATPSNMILPFFNKVRYTPLTEKSWPRRPSYTVLLKCTGLAISMILLLLTGLHFSGVKRMLPPVSDENVPPESLPPENVPPPSEPADDLLGPARGPEIHVPEIPTTFQTVGVVFYGRRSRVEILDCYLKVLLLLWLTKSCNTDFATEKPQGEWWAFG